MNRYIALVEGDAEVGNCIFCGEKRKLTGEHMFAHWVSKATSATNYPDLQLTLRTRSGNSVARYDLTSFTSPRNKGSVNFRLNILCDSCNSGWGSTLQDHTNQVLKPILNGGPLVLDDSGRELVAKWMTSFIMVRQFLHPELNSIPSESRLDFYRTQRPMTGLSVWVSKYDGDNSHECTYRALAIISETEAAPISPNTGFVTMVMGNLIFLALWSSAQNVIDKFSPADPGYLPLINAISNSTGMREFTPNPSHPQVFKPFFGNKTLPLHSMLMDLGMRQVWPTFADFNAGQQITLHRRDFDDLNNMVTYVLLTHDHSLDIARTNAGDVQRHLFSLDGDL
ncbi:hypothetical protein GJ699_04535 [Duganella sp. FT80W]|uniref:HNH endonuclease n=1 Tax=Duganella guangzhouensis TaxID=2666084 RepID=A0A6I2KU07_9BURK|nr:hypothetical protein [Duganella guangzhouensis]MRW89243.1 hypothetical protein [Duganella guangzhouensis]